MAKSTKKNKSMKKKKSINNITKENAYKKYLEKNKNKIFEYGFMKKKCDMWGKKPFTKNLDVQEDFLKEVFHKYKSNNITKHVFIKVKLLDSFYSTNLKEGLDDMVKNITKVKNFNVLPKGNPVKLVNKIKNVKSTLHDTKECISFASKYCNRCNEKGFPIYDKYVKQMLYLIDRAKPFYCKESASDETDEKPSSKKSIKHLSMNEIDSYKGYKCAVDKFIKKFNDENGKGEKMNYKQFDRYLWTWAKEILYNLNKTR